MAGQGVVTLADKDKAARWRGDPTPRQNPLLELPAACPHAVQWQQAAELTAEACGGAAGQTMAGGPAQATMPTGMPLPAGVCHCRPNCLSISLVRFTCF